jgi:hypothetical protein
MEKELFEKFATATDFQKTTETFKSLLKSLNLLSPDYFKSGLPSYPTFPTNTNPYSQLWTRNTTAQNH